MVTQYTMGHPSKYGSLRPEFTMLFLCDFQRDYEDKLKDFGSILHNAKKLQRVSQQLNIEVVVSERRGHGFTSDELVNTSHKNYRPDERSKMSMVIPRLGTYLESNNITSVMLCGIDEHFAIQETAADLKAVGISVFIIMDACSAGASNAKHRSISNLITAGCYLVTTKDAIMRLRDYSATVVDFVEDESAHRLNEWMHPVKSKGKSRHQNQPDDDIPDDHPCLVQ